MSLYVAVNTTERSAVRRRYAPKESLHVLWLKIYELAFQIPALIEVMNGRAGGVGDSPEPVEPRQIAQSLTSKSCFSFARLARIRGPHVPFDACYHEPRWGRRR